MGVGKTTIGKELARKLQYGFIDVDEEIEAAYEMKTVDIFKVHGEKRFRETEKELIIDCSKTKDKVISVGGGAFLQDEIRNACMENATVVYLDISWEYWKDRLSLLTPTRPILQGKTLDEIKDLFEERQTIYRDHHLKVTVDDLGIEASVERIQDELKWLK
jgi:shikimate kinase